MSKNFKGSPKEERALGSYVKLARAANTVLAFSREGLDEAGLTTSQFAVLEALFHVGPLCLGDLARRILTSSGNLTLVIDNLEKRKLAKRQQQGSDKRFVLASITPAGRKLIGRIFPEHSQRIVEVMNRLSPAEQEQLGKLCRKLGTGEEQS
jgi:MarR family transcriptional regulator, 2-MHQ and catechol-resistance regulon repressor